MYENQQYLILRGGNEEVASDIYGLGVRLGIYTQAFGMLLSVARYETDGIMLTAGGTNIALMASWTVLAARRNLAACESVIILAMTLLLTVIGSVTSIMSRPESKIEIAASIVSWIWAAVGSLWFWSTLLYELPAMGTPNDVWFFKRLPLDGGFRIFLLVVLACGLGFLAFAIAKVFIPQKLIPKLAEESKERLKKSVYGVYVLRLGMIQKDISESLKSKHKYIWVYWQIPYMIMVVVTIEMTIIYNNLMPETDLTLPSQLIPLLLGILVFMRGCELMTTKTAETDEDSIE